MKKKYANIKLDTDEDKSLEKDEFKEEMTKKISR